MTNTGQPVLTRRVRIVHDPYPSDPREDDPTCEILSVRNGAHAIDYICDRIRDTETWQAADGVRLALSPEDGWPLDEPDIDCDSAVRDLWLEQVRHELLVTKFNTQSGTYVAHITPDMCKRVGAAWEQAQRILDAEIKTFEMWAEGDVYGYIVEVWTGEGDDPEDEDDPDNWTEEDACWGFYGDDWFANGVSDYVPEELHEQLRNAEVEYPQWS